MNKIYLITGPAGVGKSTISKQIAKNLNKSVLIEGDDIYNLVKGGYISPWKEDNHLEFFWKNIFDLLTNSINAGYDVVFNYILSKEDVCNIKRKFANIEIKFVCLMVDEKTIAKRDKLRPINCQMGERSIVLLNEMLEENFNQQNILYSTNLTIEETFKEILKNNRFII